LYSEQYLLSKETNEYFSKSVQAVLNEVESRTVRGYCVILIEYLQKATMLNPKRGFGKSRSLLWGLQRPPIGSTTYIHCSADTSWDEVASIFILFYATTARNDVELSIDPKNRALIALCSKLKLRHSAESEDEMTARLSSQSDVFNVVHANGPTSNFPMAGLFTSIYLPLGHIKSTQPNDKEFYLRGDLSKKWLTSLF
jgi:hypothetical protein